MGTTVNTEEWRRVTHLEQRKWNYRIWSIFFMCLLFVFWGGGFGLFVCFFNPNPVERVDPVCSAPHWGVSFWESADVSVRDSDWWTFPAHSWPVFSLSLYCYKWHTECIPYEPHTSCKDWRNVFCYLKALVTKCMQPLKVKASSMKGRSWDKTSFTGYHYPDGNCSTISKALEEHWYLEATSQLFSTSVIKNG